MKIHEVIRLRNVYGGETTLNDLVSRFVKKQMRHFTMNLQKSQNITGGMSPIALQSISFRLRWTYLLTDMQI